MQAQFVYYPGDGSRAVCWVCGVRQVSTFPLGGETKSVLELSLQPASRHFSHDIIELCIFLLY
jgi:hypothetical protein